MAGAAARLIESLERLGVFVKASVVCRRNRVKDSTLRRPGRLIRGVPPIMDVERSETRSEKYHRKTEMTQPFDGHTVIEFLRDGRYRHIRGVIDEEVSRPMRKIMRRLTANITIEEYVDRTIRELAATGPVVYAMKYRSLYDLWFLRLTAARLGWPLPAYVFDVSPSEMGSASKLFPVWKERIRGLFRSETRAGIADESVLEEIFKHGGAAVMFLVDDDSLQNRYLHPHRDPLHMILEVQSRFGGCISVVPLYVLYDRTAPRTAPPVWESIMGNPEKPGILRRIRCAWWYWMIPELLMGEPIPLVAEFEEFGGETPWQELPFALRTRLIHTVNNRIRANRGPIKASRAEIKERVLQNERVKTTITQMAAEDNRSADGLRKKAESYVDEIAADPSINVIRFWYHTLGRLFNRMFETLDLRPSDFDMLKQTAVKAPLIYVPCHKSHFDYLIMPWTLFVQRMTVPYIAAGKNLSFWPFGPMIRKTAAFFLRRSFKGERLYAKVFAAYVHVLLEGGAHIQVYLEGGRSRTGKLLTPRLGMLAFILESLESGATDDLYFVPSYLGYEHVPEEKSYLRESSGVEKKPESLLMMIRGRKLITANYGKVHLRFHSPTSYREFARQWRSTPHLQGEPSVRNPEFLAEFAQYLMSGIVNASVVTAVHVAAAALMSPRIRRVPHETVMRSSHAFLQYVEYTGIEMEAGLKDPDRALSAGLKRLASRNLTEPETDSDAAVYAIPDKKRPNLQFYANGMVNVLWPAAAYAVGKMTAARQGTRGENAFDIFSALIDILKLEIIRNPLKTNEEIYGETEDFFTGEGRGNDESLAAFAGVLRDFMDLYYRVLECVRDPGGGLSEKEIIRRIHADVRENTKAGEGAPPPTISSIAVRNALTHFGEKKIIEYRPGRKSVQAVFAEADRRRWAELLREILESIAYRP